MAAFQGKLLRSHRSSNGIETPKKLTTSGQSRLNGKSGMKNTLALATQVERKRVRRGVKETPPHYLRTVGGDAELPARKNPPDSSKTSLGGLAQFFLFVLLVLFSFSILSIALILIVRPQDLFT